MQLLRGRLAGRAAWAFTAQAFSSVNSFILTLSVLSVSSQGQFATFTLGFTSFLLVSQLSRSAVDVPILILYSDARAGRELYQGAAGTGVMIGVVSGALLAAAGLISGDAPFYLLAGAMPLLLFQQAVRHLAFAEGRPQLAAASDGLWFALQVTGGTFALVRGSASVEVLLAVWACSGAVAGLALGRRFGLLPHLGGAIEWLRANFALCRRLVTEFVLNSGSYYLLLYGIAVLAEPVQLGNLRAAQTFIGPVIVALLAGNALGIPESVRLRTSRPKLRRFAALLSGGLAAAALTWGGLVFAVLPRIGPRVFADTWEGARGLLPLLTVFAAAVGGSTGPSAALRALGENGWILKARAVSGGVALAIGLPGTASFGSMGVLVALAVTEAAFGVAAWLRLRTASLTARADDSAAGAYVPY